MKKFLALMLAMAMLLALCACSTDTPNPDTDKDATTPAEDTHVVLKLSEQNAESSINATYWKKVAELVNEYSNGTVELQCYWSNSLCSYDIESCIAGLCDMLQMEPTSVSDVCSLTSALSAPFVYDDIDHYAKVMTYGSDTLNYLNENLEGTGIKFLGGFNAGNRYITSNHPIYEPADLKGFKMRILQSDIHTALFNTYLKAAGTPMNFSDVPAALMTNTIEGQENPLSVITTNKLYELQKYCIMTGHMPTTMGAWINENSFNKLSANQQEALIKAIKDGQIWIHEYIADKSEEWTQECENGGMTFIDESNGLDIEAFCDVANNLYDDFADEWGDMITYIKAAA